MAAREGYENRWGRLKLFLGVLALVFAVTLASVIANRLSDEALGVLAGAFCGVGAAIPTSLLILAVSRREGAGGATDDAWGQERATRYEPRQAYPPVVVVSPASPEEQRRRPSWDALRPSLSAPIDREFRVVGGTPDAREEVWYDDERCA